MKFIKKNQVVIAVIGLMLITAGYLNFTNNGQINTNGVIETGALADSEQMAAIGDAKLVSTKPADESNNKNENTKQENNTKDKTETSENTIKQESKNEDSKSNEKTNEIDSGTKDKEIQTNSKETATDEYFTKSRLERETMYSQMLESYQKILSNTNVSESQKQTAQKEIKNINNQKNAIMITETLIKTKGFEDLIIFINDKSINVIIKSKELKADQIAQIQNIITRELKADIGNIHISNRE